MSALDGIPCPLCGYPDCNSAKGCLKRQRDRRHRAQVAELIAQRKAAEERAEVLRKALQRAWDRDYAFDSKYVHCLECKTSFGHAPTCSVVQVRAALDLK